jgi:hypothetical protein
MVAINTGKKRKIVGLQDFRPMLYVLIVQSDER